MARFGVIQEREKWDQLYFSKAVKPKQNRPSPGNFYFSPRRRFFGRIIKYY